MATPELFTFEVEATSGDQPAATLILRTFEIEATLEPQPLGTSHLYTFEIEAPIEEPTPPNVTLDNPTAGILEGIVSLEATASDANPGGVITQVEFLVDGSVVNTDTTAPYQFNYDTTILSDATHNFQARATNGFGQTTTTATLNLLVDNSPPVVNLTTPTVGPLTGIVSLEATASDAESGVTQVEFLVDGSVVNTDTVAPYQFNYDTSVLVDGSHNFQARATNGSGLTTTTAVLNLQVDNSIPTVNLTAPTVGPLTGIFNMEATASDPDSGISLVEFLVDGSVVGSDGTAPYSFSYDSSVLTDGLHNFQARATNNVGLQATTPALNLIVDHSGAVVSLTAPTAGPITGITNLGASAVDTHSGVTLVEFLVDGSPVGSDTVAPYSFSYDTSLLSDGSHDFSARATNGVGIVSTSVVESFIVDNSPPTVTYLNPVASPVFGVIDLQADAEDLVSGIERVEFLVNGTVVGTDFIPNSPYSVSFNTNLLPNGTHNFQARGYNNAGLFTLTPTLNLIVNNAPPQIQSTILDCDSVHEPLSDIAVRSEFVYRALTNFLDLLSDEDRDFLARFWGGLQQISEDLYLQLYQNYDSKNIFTVPVFRRSRWNEILLNYDAHPAIIRSTLDQLTYDTSIGSGSNTLTFSVDGNAITVVFSDSATNPIANVVDEINSAAAAALNRPDLRLAGNVSTRLVLRSLNVGTEATIAISEADGNPNLGFWPGVSSIGEGISTRAEPAQLTGTVIVALADTSIATGEPQMKLKIDGGPEVTINFPNDNSTTVFQILDSINLAVPNLATLDSEGRILLTSGTTTCDSSLEITLGNSELGFITGQLAFGCGQAITNIYPEYPVSYQVRVGTSDDELNLVPLEDPSVVSIPALRSRIDAPRVVLGQADKPHLGLDEKEENFGTSLDPEATVISCLDVGGWNAEAPNLVECSFIVRDGRIHFNKNVDTQLVNLCLDILWAENVYRNDTYLLDNFGFPIQVERDNSLEYKNVLQGLHKAYWSGPIIKDTEIGLNLLFDLPVAPISGKIEGINQLENPEVTGTQASQYFDMRDNNRTFAFTIDGVFVFVIFGAPGTAQIPDPVPATGPSVSLQNYPATAAPGERSIVNDINAAAVAAGLPPTTASAFAPDPLQPNQVQIKLTGLNSVRIDTVTGNAALGFSPGAIDYGTNEIIIDDQTFQISTEFPITKQVGEVVERLDPLTDGVDLFDYISDPLWWEVFGIASLDSRFALADGYSKEDLKLINEILKYHLFGVKIIPDAFNRLGPIEFGVVTKFINDIKPLTKNYILIIPFVLLDIFTLTDDANLDGRPDDRETIGLVFPPTLDVPPYNLLEGAANLPPPHGLSFTTSYGGSRDNVVDGTSPMDTTFLDLDGYDIHMINGGSVIVTTGGYQAAEYTGSAAGPLNTSGSSGMFTMQVNGQTVMVAFGNGVGEIPVGSSVSVHEVASVLTDALNSVVTGYGEVLVNQSQQLVFRGHRTDGSTPTIDIQAAYPELGIASAPGLVSGVGGTLVSSVNF